MLNVVSGNGVGIATYLNYTNTNAAKIAAATTSFTLNVFIYLSS